MHKLYLIVVFLFVHLHAGVAYNEMTLNHVQNAADGGTSVALSNEWAAVGAYDPADSKSCYVSMFKFDYTAMTWTTPVTLGDANGNCNGNKGFGVAVSLSGTKLAVGLYQFGNGQNTYGAYTTYEFDGTDWIEKDLQVLAYDKQNDSGYGETISIRGDYLIVGAPYFDSVNGTNAGKVYIYNWTTGTLLAEVLGNSANENFGTAVTGSGTEILIGAPGYSSNIGAVYLYNFNGTTMQLEGIEVGQIAGARMGTQVAMDSEHILASGSFTQSFNKINGTWKRGIIRGGTDNADVSISDGVFAIGYMGTKVENFLDLTGDLATTNYYAPVVPSVVDATETAEDISLYKNQLLVKHSTTQPAYAYELPCGFGTQLVENEWQLIGVPCKIASSTTVADVFNTNVSGEDDLGTYGTNWIVYEQNSTYGSTSASYIELNASSVVTQGKGYWIISDHNVTTRVDSSVSSTGTTTLTTSPYLSALVNVGAQSDVPLPWANIAGGSFVKVLISNNLPRSFKWENVVVYVPPSSYAPMSSTAAAAVLTNATAYVYDSTQTGQPYRAVSGTPGLGDTIEAGQGFWVQVESNSTGIQLQLPFEK